MTELVLVLLFFAVSVSVYGAVVTLLYLRSQRLVSQTRAERFSHHQGVLADNDEAKARIFARRADEALVLTKTLQKFIPRQFVDHFAKHGTVELTLGHADEDEVAILFCDIRGFTGLSERMGPQQLMTFLNSYFLRMNEPIHQNRGFIDKFIGDAIMALFDHPGGSAKAKAIDAVSAALDLRKALTLYNQHRQNSHYDPIGVGIGIHFGPVILGTVGSEDRMDTTVIGDSVNIAARLESLTPLYNADIIVSATVLETIGAEFGLKTRLLDWVRVKGRRAPIEIYEVLSHLSEPEQQQKFALQTQIAAGLACRIKQDWDGALVHFYKAREMSPDDSLALHHIRTIEAIRYQPFPPNWDGAIATDGSQFNWQPADE
ncbi:adenylate/guanylate cyclase domain-containing protein [Salinimonas lutimaris]|uniref:adenylate/guanylate cyclase domain-containing protein n=1 Tax=Salinimonas lutimaris TaxID=914153 RepID=UPI001E60C1B1|nr:adenylate/guanylate cyclase domain-containing protein [Salinimonas lutimaris]